MLTYARQRGADALATGHYARTRKDGAGRFRLLKGVDTSKDQSYFLAFLNQYQLSRACFPLGDRHKSRVKRLAAEHNLTPWHKNESQDICFIPSGSYHDFMGRQYGSCGKPGPIRTVDGRIIGRHPGLHLFTVGQRKGINCPDKTPYYVVELLYKENCLVVGKKADTLAYDLYLKGVNWIWPKPAAPMEADTRIRYRHRAAPSVITPLPGSRVMIRFKTPQAAITPGQAAVFYRDQEIIGSGWITASVN